MSTFWLSNQLIWKCRAYFFDFNPDLAQTEAGHPALCKPLIEPSDYTTLQCTPGVSGQRSEVTGQAELCQSIVHWCHDWLYIGSKSPK